MPKKNNVPFNIFSLRSFACTSAARLFPRKSDINRDEMSEASLKYFERLSSSWAMGIRVSLDKATNPLKLGSTENKQ